MLNFIFATRTVPPRRIQAGIARSNTYYEQHADIAALQGTWKEYQTIFVFSLITLSRIAGYEVVPGISNSGVKGTFLQRGDSRINHRAVPHCPKNLLCSSQVSAWKNDILFRHTNPAVITGHILQIPHGQPHIEFVADIQPPEYPHTYSYNARVNATRRSVLGHGNPDFAPAKFLHD